MDIDLKLTSSPQRHVLQKLLTWEHLGLAVENLATRWARLRSRVGATWGQCSPLRSFRP
ncbi:hypothetical protein DFAR_4000021 [Desulfarculales bacterium]